MRRNQPLDWILRPAPLSVKQERLTTDDSFTFSADNLRRPAPETAAAANGSTGPDAVCSSYRQFADAVTGNSHGMMHLGAISAPVDTG